MGGAVRIEFRFPAPACGAQPCQGMDPCADIRDGVKHQCGIPDRKRRHGLWPIRQYRRQAYLRLLDWQRHYHDRCPTLATWKCRVQYLDRHGLVSDGSVNLHGPELHGDMQPTVKPIYDSSNTVNPWGQDLAHAREMFLVPYLFTGKYVYLEGEQAMAAWEILAPAVDVTGTTPSFIYSRWGKRGIIYDPFNTVRATAWPLRNVGGAALISPDGSVEQAYFLNKLNNNLENFEGAYNITNGWFPPANSSCTGFNQATDTVIWRQARCYYESGWSNPLFASLQHDPSSPVCDGCDGCLTNDGISPWMEGYWVQTTGQLRDWGFKADYIHTAVAGRMLSMFTDSTFYAGTSAGPAGAITYRTPAMTPSVNATRTGYIQTWAAVKAATLNTEIGRASCRERV